jgi:hypothetical protein
MILELDPHETGCLFSTLFYSKEGPGMSKWPDNEAKKVIYQSGSLLYDIYSEATNPRHLGQYIQIRGENDP